MAKAPKTGYAGFGPKKEVKRAGEIIAEEVLAAMRAAFRQVVTLGWHVD
jgi:hypothetical protein